MASDGWTVREAAARLLCSESKVRRRLRPGGDLKALDAPGPLRVEAASLAAAQTDMLRRMGVSGLGEQVGCMNPQGADQAQTDLQRENERLTRDLVMARGALDDLTAAHATLLDTFRRLSQGATPNH